MDEDVRQWRREAKVDAAVDLVARVVLRAAWWLVLIAAGYIAGNMAGGGS